MWGARVGIQVFKRELHTYIHLDYVRVKFLSCIKKKFTTLSQQILNDKFLLTITSGQKSSLSCGRKISH